MRKRLFFLILTISFFSILLCNGHYPGDPSSNIIVRVNSISEESAVGGSVFNWTRTMGPGGGVVRGALAISVTNPNVLYAGTDISGVFKSEDYGLTWRDIGLPHNPIEGRSIDIDYTNSNIVYVGMHDGIYKTVDGGETWEKTFSTDPFWMDANRDIGGPGITTISLDPKNNDVIYAGSWGGHIIKSVDQGSNWMLKENGFESNHIVSKIIVDHVDSDVVYAATGYWDTDGGTTSDGNDHPGRGEGVFKTVDGGENWFPINNGLPIWRHYDTNQEHITVNDLEMDPIDNNILYIAIAENLTDDEPNTSIYKSIDGGANWVPFVDPEFAPVQSLAIDPNDSNIIYASNGKNRLKKTTDGGQEWKLISGTELKTNPFLIDIIIDPTNTSNLYGASYYKGIIKSTDEGETWNRATNGINIVDSYFIAVDPTDFRKVYAGAKESILFKTEDGGDSWISSGLMWEGAGYTYGILVDPENPDIIYTGTGWQGGYHTDGIFKTIDGGETWFPINKGIGESVISEESESLKVHEGYYMEIYYDTGMGGVYTDDTYQPSSTTWIAVETGGAYHFSYNYMGHFDALFILGLDNAGNTRIIHEDNHYNDPSSTFRESSFSFSIPDDIEKIMIRINTWRSTIFFDDFSLTHNSRELLENGDLSQGLAHWSYQDIGTINRNIYFIAMDPDDSTNIFAGTEDGYVYRSINSGEDWVEINNGMTFDSINTIAVNPLSGTIFAGTNSKYRDGGAVFRSYDGENWEQLATVSTESGEHRRLRASPRYCYAIEFDPVNSQIVYSADAKETLLFKSTDNGDTWETVLDLRDFEEYSGIHSIAVDPQNPERIYSGVTGEKGTIHASLDGGDTWDILNDDLTFTTIWGHSQLQIDPLDKDTVYAGTWGGGTYKTTNGGEEWELLDEDHTFSPTCLAISEGNPNIIYACDRTQAKIHRSDDGGETWYTYYDFGPGYMMTSTVAIDPNDPDVIYAAAFKPPVAHQGGLYKIDDSGIMADLSSGLPRSVLEIEIDQSNPDIIYVTTHIHGVYKSVDGGTAWEQLDDVGTGLPRTGIYDIDIDPDDSDTLYVTALSGELPDYMLFPGILNLEGECGVYKSVDGGAHWVHILQTESEARGIDIDSNDSENLYVADMMGGVWVSNDAGQTWRQENNGLGSVSMTSVKVKDDQVYASTQGSGVYSGQINTDGSISWDDSRSNKPKAYVHKMQIEIDPTDPNRIYASAYPGGLLRSDDGGLNWNDKNFLTPSIEVDDPVLQGYYSFAINPEEPENIWLGAYGKGVFVSYDRMEYDMFANGQGNTMMDKRITSLVINPNNADEIFIGADEGVFASRDGGSTWAKESDGLLALEVVSLAINNEGTEIYAGTRGASVWKASVSDMAWSQTTGPVTKPRICWIKIDPDNSEVIYIGLNPSGMYKSQDGGATWREINRGLTNTVIYPIEINPENTDILYVGTGYKRDINTESIGGAGIYKSENGGETWYSANNGLTEDIVVNEIIFDPQDPDVIYIGTEGFNAPHEGIFMSVDGGASWQSINNHNIEEFPIYSFAFDQSGNIFYVGTGFGGVWRGIREGSTTISCQVSHRTVDMGSSISVSGASYPPLRDREVTLTYTKPDGAILSLSINTDSTGEYQDTFTPTLEGSWSVEASWIGDSEYLGVSSTAFSFTCVGEEPEPERTHELALFEGWNLIGLPLTPEDPSIEVVLADIIDDVNSVWTFDGETETWSSYSPGAPGNLVEMVNDRGYWIMMTEDSSLTVSGESAPTCELSLFEGWNFIGLPLTPEDQRIEVVLANIVDDVNSVWAFDGETETWSSYSPGAPSNLVEMVEGRGYWVKVTEDATLTVHG